MQNAAILVVEDNRIVAKDLENRLIKMGYLVLSSVASGEKALKEIDKKCPDLVLMDIRLSGEMDGIETALSLRSSYDIPIIFITALDDDKTLKRAKKAEPYGYIVKPFKTIELKSVIEVALYKHKMERKLKVSEAWLATILNSIGDGVIATDEKGYIRFMNLVTEDMLGCLNHEMIGKPLNDFFWIEDEYSGERVTGLAEGAIDSGRTIRLYKDILLRTKDNIKIPITCTSSPIKFADDKCRGAVLVIQDKTSIRDVQSNLRNSEMRFHELFNHMPTGIAIYDSDDSGKSYKLKDMNRSGEKICRLNKNDIINRNVESVFPGIDNLGLLESFRNVSLSGNPQTLPVRKYKDDRLSFWVKNCVYKLPSGEIVAIFDDVTEKESLREERNRIVNLSYDLICICGIDGYFKFLNPAFERTLGFLMEEFLNRPIFNFIYPDDHEKYEYEVNKLLINESSIGYEIRYTHKNGSYRIIQWNSQYVAEKEVYYCIGRDVTKRREMDRNLRERKKILGRIVNNIPGVVYRCLNDENWTMLFLSDGIFNLTGYRKEMLVGNCYLSFAEVIHPDDREKVTRDIQEALDDKKPFDITYRIITHDKDVKWCWKKGEGIFSDEGASLYLEGIIVDITKQKLAENCLKNAHERFVTVMDSIEAHVYIVDIETYEVLFMNKGMKEAFGKSITNQICYKAFYNKDQPCQHCTIDKLIDQDGKIKTEKYLWEHKNPITNRWYVNSDRVIHWKNDRLVRIQIATDITKLKKIEIEYRQAQKNDAIGVLANGIAHDFNNILSSVIGFAELCMDDVIKESLVYKNLNEILTAGNRAKDLVRRILTFSRKTDHVFKPFKINAVLSEVINMLRATLPSYIAIECEITKKDYTINGDFTQIHQIILNLATNGAHAMGDSGGTLRVNLDTVSVSHHIQPIQEKMVKGQYLRLAVSDTGCGIEKEIMGTIFDPYFTTKERGKGTGLGLSMVLGIVKAHNGYIHVVSEVGEGTTFQIYLPIYKKKLPSKKMIGFGPELKGGNEHILMVDDEPQIGRMYSQLFGGLGYHVTTMTDSKKAFRVFKQAPEHFDIIITDMTMPYMTGDKLADRIKAIRSDIPIILCTGFSEKINDQSFKNFKIDELLMKPSNKKKLVRTVRTLLNKNLKSDNKRV